MVVPCCTEAERTSAGRRSAPPVRDDAGLPSGPDPADTNDPLREPIRRAALDWARTGDLLIAASAELASLVV